MAALLVKLIAPVPDEFSLLVADGPSVNWRSVLPPVPIYCSVPPFNTRLLATEPDAPIELFDPPLSRQSTYSEPALMVVRSEEHTSELQSLMRNTSAVFCLKKKNS